MTTNEKEENRQETQEEQSTQDTESKDNKKQSKKTKAKGQKQQQQQQKKDIDFLLDVPLQVSVEIGRARLLVKELLHMKEGTVVELDKLAGEPLDLYVNSRLIARGEAVKVKDKLGLRLTDVVSPTERLEKLG